MPIAFMQKDFAMFTDTLTDDILKDGYDIVLINRYVSNISVLAICEMRKKHGFKLVVDIDDYWHLDPFHILYGRYPYKEIMDHIRAADMVTCTHDRLLSEIKELNKNVHCLPNALPYGQDQFVSDHTPSTGRVRFIYTGSVTHEKDVDLLRNPMKRVASDTNLESKIHFCLCGYQPENKYTEPIWHRMIGSFLCGFKVQGYVKAELPVDQYMDFYKEADVSVVPLVYSKFNSMKSNLKVLEAACKKIPVIASCVQPYSDCLYIHPVHSQGDWYTGIKKLATDSIYRQELGEANHEWCVTHFDLMKVNETRRQLFESIV
jgi:glycosyltransferase involved in cell wall biosynthesis